MKERIAVAAAVAFFIASLPGCPVGDVEPCDSGVINVTGNFLDGRGFPAGSPPPPPPVRVTASVRSDYLIQGVTIGGAPANYDATNRQWVAQLYTQDLERNRDGGVAQVRIEATDFCGLVRTLADEATIPLGPVPGVAVQDLNVLAEYLPAGECSLPVNGSVVPAIRVTASKDSMGAQVTLLANQGTFASGGTSAVLTLQPAGDHSEQTTYFKPSAEGFAVITASATGAAAPPLVIPVIAKPRITGPAETFPRGIPEVATVESAGNLAYCLVQPIVTGTSTVRFIDPPLGVYDGGVVDVRRSPVSCTEPEFVQVEITFAADAPDAGAVTLRCSDSFNQETVMTYRVAAE